MNPRVTLYLGHLVSLLNQQYIEAAQFNNFSSFIRHIITLGLKVYKQQLKTQTLHGTGVIIHQEASMHLIELHSLMNQHLYLKFDSDCVPSLGENIQFQGNLVDVTKTPIEIQVTSWFKF